MKKEGEPFRFKKFTVNHSRSSMKVGVDGVLIGAWARVDGKRGLDVGCGCGLVALMAAQRNVSAFIDAVDIDGSSIVEAGDNFITSPWGNRLNAVHSDFVEFAGKEENRGHYDFILSNPPFFSSGVSPSSRRETARHESSLSPAILLEAASIILRPGGTVSLILPLERYKDLEGEVNVMSLNFSRICHVADRPGKNCKRVMVELRKYEKGEGEVSQLFIRDGNGEYSEAYKDLTGAFYLNF